MQICKYVFIITTQSYIKGLKDTSQAILLLALECLTCDELDDQNFIGKSHHFKAIRMECVKFFCKFSFQPETLWHLELCKWTKQ